MNNCLRSTGKILELLKVPYTLGYLKDAVLSHPYFPSLLSISDTLDRYNLNQIPVKIGKEKLDQVSLPCVVQVAGSGMDLFYTLAKLSENEVVYFDENGKKGSMGREDFLRIWTGVVLLVERNEDSAEPGIEEKSRNSRTRSMLTGFLVMSTLTGLIISFKELPGNWDIVPASGYMLLKLAGLGISTLLLWREIDRDNPTVQKFCSGGGKTDCNAVLDAADFSFAGGTASLGSLAFAYFFAGSLMLLTHSHLPSLLALLGWISIASFPIVILSFYCQVFKIKKWCRFCLMVQGVLLLEILLSWMGQFYQGTILLGDLAAFVVFFLAAVLGWMYLKPVLAPKDDIYFYKRSLGKFKNNPDIFEKLLSQSRKISNLTDGLGILLKSGSPRYQVLKVCNPYCGPCAKAHPELEKLVKEGKIDLQIIFYPNADMQDPRTKTISHFLAIAGKGDQEVTRKALDTWYGAGKKDYETFSRQFQMNGELAQQGEKLQAMKTWCESEGITHTPTIFVNGCELPEDYSVEDLKEILI